MARLRLRAREHPLANVAAGERFQNGDRRSWEREDMRSASFCMRDADRFLTEIDIGPFRDKQLALAGAEHQAQCKVSPPVLVRFLSQGRIDARELVGGEEAIAFCLRKQLDASCGIVSDEHPPVAR